MKFLIILNILPYLHFTLNQPISIYDDDEELH